MSASFSKNSRGNRYKDMDRGSLLSFECNFEGAQEALPALTMGLFSTLEKGRCAASAPLKLER